jgi:hypothetical protein
MLGEDIVHGRLDLGWVEEGDCGVGLRIEIDEESLFLSESDSGS